jgi:hypothetical protein
MTAVVTAGVITLGACSAPKDDFSLRPAAGQEAVVRDGVPALVSTRKHTVFLRPVAPQQLANGRPRFVVAILNRGRTPVTFNVSSVSVETLSPRRASVRVYTHAELAQEVENDRNAQLTLQAIAGALGSYSAAQSGYSHTTGTISGPYSYGSYSQTTYSPGRAQAAIDANTDRTMSNNGGHRGPGPAQAG